MKWLIKLDCWHVARELSRTVLADGRIRVNVECCNRWHTRIVGQGIKPYKPAEESMKRRLPIRPGEDRMNNELEMRLLAWIWFDQNPNICSHCEECGKPIPIELTLCDRCHIQAEGN